MVERGGRGDGKRPQGCSIRGKRRVLQESEPDSG
ncbi:hypothetical protein D4764_02G0005340 [Takifugu flavidus]|uniref:Uncharacterized protein n=1 Tax=Takifugu flavidus TaxID=433684 RepID=A0A5C6NJT2_9TELE|nr:hypothetical protein D4764_02G0005340 [Takifugu flavidus]